MTTPLSDEQLAQLRERSARSRFSATPQRMETLEEWWRHLGSLLEIRDWYCTDIPALLDEVDRLRAENERLRTKNAWLDKYAACRLCPTGDPGIYYLEGAPGEDDDDDATE